MSRMGDARATWDNSAWNNNFHHQYLQHHARMTQWIQNLHQNIPQTWQNSFKHGNHTCCHHNHHPNQQLPVLYQGHVPQQGHYGPQQGNYVPQQASYVPQQGHYGPQQNHYVSEQRHHVPQQGYHVPQQGHNVPQQNHDRHQRPSFRHHGNSKYISQNETNYRSRSETSIDHATDNEGEGNEDEGEWTFNVDAILAFRAEKEESAVEEEAKSEESFELVDTILDENFEFVELDDAGQLHKIFGRPTAPDAKGDVEYDRESRIILYGDRADRIAGLETSLEIMFDHLNDLQQPVVYPHV